MALFFVRPFVHVRRGSTGYVAYRSSNAHGSCLRRIFLAAATGSIIYANYIGILDRSRLRTTKAQGRAALSKSAGQISRDNGVLSQIIMFVHNYRPPTLCFPPVQLIYIYIYINTYPSRSVETVRQKLSSDYYHGFGSCPAIARAIVVYRHHKSSYHSVYYSTI